MIKTSSTSDIKAEDWILGDDFMEDPTSESSELSKLWSSDFDMEGIRNIFGIDDDDFVLSKEYSSEWKSFPDEYTVAKCLEEMFQFALKDNPDGEKHVTTEQETDTDKYFGSSITDILSKWETESNCEAAWIYQEFKEDISPENVNLGEAQSSLLQLKSEISAKDVGAASLSEKFSCQKRLDFVQTFCKVLLQGNTILADDMPCEEITERYQVLWSQMGNITSVTYKQNVGYCPGLLVDVAAGTMKSMETKCNFMFESCCKRLTMPVQVYTPPKSCIFSSESESSDDMKNGSNSPHQLRKCLAQHILQLLVILHYRLTFVEKEYNENKTITQMGMFMTGNMVYFTKVITSLRHLSAYFPDLLPVLVLPSEALKRRKEKGIRVVTSRWCMDLSKYGHRNSLMVFLAEYFHGVNYS